MESRREVGGQKVGGRMSESPEERVQKSRMSEKSERRVISSDGDLAFKARRLRT